MFKKLCFIVLGAVFVSSCGSDDDGNSGGAEDCSLVIKDQNAQGKFEGVDFFIQGGSVRLISEKPLFTLFLQELKGDVCDSQDDTQRILFGSNIQLKEGVYPLDNLTTVSFQSATTTGLATCGKIEILEVTDAFIKLKLVAQADATNFINGNFGVIRCKN